MNQLVAAINVPRHVSRTVSRNYVKNRYALDVEQETTNRSMYCGLIVGNSVVAVGKSSESPGARLRGGHNSQVQSVTRHAEMDALRYLRCHAVRNAGLVVVRKLKNGEYGNSRPCKNCTLRLLRYHKKTVSSVTFFEAGSWHTMSPEKCLHVIKLSSLDRRFS